MLDDDDDDDEAPLGAARAGAASVSGSVSVHNSFFPSFLPSFTTSEKTAIETSRARGSFCFCFRSQFLLSFLPSFAHDLGEDGDGDLKPRDALRERVVDRQQPPRVLQQLRRVVHLART